MFLTPLSSFSQSLLGNISTGFKERISNSVSKPYSAKKGNKHSAKGNWPHQIGHLQNFNNQMWQSEKLNNKQQNKPNDHPTHFLSGLNQLFTKRHNAFPFFGLTITPFPLSPPTLWGD